MLRAVFRLSLSIGGALLASLLVASIEARAMMVTAAEGGVQGLSFVPLLLAELGVLLPVSVAVGVAVGVASLALAPGEVRSFTERLESFRCGSVMDRLNRATLLPLAIVAAFAWCVGSAHLARVILAAGKPQEAGFTLGIASVGLLLALFATAFALVPLVRRGLALGGGAAPRLLDPAFTGFVALALVSALFALGIGKGDTGGDGAYPLGIFGVLKRAELDLRPVANLGLLALGAHLGPVAFARPSLRDARGKVRRSALLGLGLTALAGVVLGVLTLRASSALDLAPNDARAIEKFAPLGKISLGILRRLGDHDKDGASAHFGGGDCNDRDPDVNPGAIDVPGNGVDEDCSGADTPAVAEPAKDEGAARGDHPKAARPRHNVILLTVDTLRTDLGFLGYDDRVSPNLDALAKKSAVFERAYAMASYTGKSVGPMLIGKYPSETRRDGSHFNTYAQANVFVAERARDAGFRTFAGHCHWYFRNPTGLNQGMDAWDTSAIPAAMGDNDTSVTSDRMGDLALRMLAKPENVAGPVGGEGADVSDAGATRPFFAWFHFFDPHAQYVAHPGAPKFEGKSSSKNLYDEEVWFTDKHVGRILDFVASQPWGENTAIVVTADHGEAFNDHGMSWHGREIWESLIRVPLIVYVPGGKPVVIPVRRSQIDLVPTLLDLMGLPLPEPGELRGKSLLDDIEAPAGAWETRDVYVDMPAGPYNELRRAIITGPGAGMKLIHFGGSMMQLYDLDTDPGEKKDLAADRALRDPVFARMSALRGGLREIDVKPTP